MTAAQPQVTLLTIDEYAALGEVDNGYTELLEGRLVTSSRPDHLPAQRADSGRRGGRNHSRR